MSRCRSVIEARIPDEPSITGASVLIQCEKPDGHSGLCRNDERVTWPGPKLRTGEPMTDDILVTETRPGHAPTRSHDDDAGLDLRAADDHSIPVGRNATVNTGITIAVPHGHVGMVCPRSGLAARHGITVANSPGIVDSGYRGEVQVILRNNGPEPFTVNRGDRIAQLVVLPVNLARVSVVDQLNDTCRGESGIGSTGQ